MAVTIQELRAAKEAALVMARKTGGSTDPALVNADADRWEAVIDRYLMDRARRQGEVPHSTVWDVYAGGSTPSYGVSADALEAELRRRYWPSGLYVSRYGCDPEFQGWTVRLLRWSERRWGRGFPSQLAAAPAARRTT